MNKLPKLPRMAIFVPVFAAVFAVLEAVYVAIPDQLLLAAYHHAIVAPAAALIGLVAPAEHVLASGNGLVSSQVRFDIVRGCDGSGLLFLLAAAIIAFPSSVRQKLSGLALAAAGVYLVNELRLLILYATQRFRPGWFATMHLYVLPLALIVLSAIFFLAWMRAQPDDAPSNA